MKKLKRVVITGGHHNSALVVAEKLRDRGWEVLWFGHRFTMRHDKRLSAEYREVTEAGFRFFEIKAGKISRRYRLVNFLRFPWGFFQSFYYLLKLRPSLIFSFGGYLAVPVAMAGFLLRISIVVHEQTVVYGWANWLTAVFSKKIFVSWRSSLKHFSPRKVIFTGLPLRPEIFKSQPGMGFGEKRPTIYITGGKQGSHVINQAVEGCLVSLLSEYNLIHQCGASTVHDDFSYFKNLRKSLPAKIRRRYMVRDYFSRSEVGAVFASSDLIVSRSGAHIVYEIAALGKPAIFIPIPWSRANEQLENAQKLVRAGTAQIVSQKDLSSQSLSRMIEIMIAGLSGYRKKAFQAKKLVRLDAADRIVDLIEKL